MLSREAQEKLIDVIFGTPIERASGRVQGDDDVTAIAVLTKLSERMQSYKKGARDGSVTTKEGANAAREFFTQFTTRQQIAIGCAVEVHVGLCNTLMAALAHEMLKSVPKEDLDQITIEAIDGDQRDKWLDEVDKLMGVERTA